MMKNSVYVTLQLFLLLAGLFALIMGFMLSSPSHLFFGAVMCLLSTRVGRRRKEWHNENQQRLERLDDDVRHGS